MHSIFDIYKNMGMKIIENQRMRGARLRQESSRRMKQCMRQKIEELKRMSDAWREDIHEECERMHDARREAIQEECERMRDEVRKIIHEIEEERERMRRRRLGESSRVQTSMN